MATIPPKMSPAEAQPVSFSAHYLFWGADNLREDSISHILARELYSFGVAIVAPVGIFYHLCMAGYGALAQLVMDEGKEKKELSTWTWQHLEVTKFDLMAWGSILISVVLAISIVAFITFAISGEFLFAPLSLAPFLLLLLLPPEDILSVGFAINPSWFLRLLFCNPPGDAYSSQEDLYLVRMFLSPLIAEGSYLLNTPLQDDEISFLKFDRTYQITGDHFHFRLISLPYTMRNCGRTPSHMQALMQKLFDKLDEIRKLKEDYLANYGTVLNDEAQKTLMAQADKLLDGALSKFEKEEQERRKARAS